MGTTSYEYIISLQDKMSGTMTKIVGTSGAVVDKLESMNTAQKTLRDTNKDLGGSIFALKQKIDLLQAEKELIPPSGIGTIKRYNSEIKSLAGEINRLENMAGGGRVKRWFNDLTTSVPALSMLTNPLVLVTAGIYKLKQVISGSESMWNAQIESETKLAAVMRNTMDATQEEINGVLALASAQQKLGVIGDEVQLSGGQELATYLTRKDSMEKLLPVMNDMLAQQYGMNATQEQAINIASMMGKVMDGQVGALSRYGYKFDEAQEKILKYGTETQRAATLAEVISESVGGVNAALAATPEGKWKQHTNDMGDLQERVGSLVVRFRNAMFPVFEKGAILLANVVDWIDANAQAITVVLSKIASVLTGAFTIVYEVTTGVVSTISWLWDLLASGNPVVYGIAAAIGAYTIALNAASLAASAKALIDKVLLGGTKLLTIAQAALNTVFLASPLGWIALAIGAVVAAVTVCWQKFEGFRQVVFGVWNLMKEFGSTLYAAVLEPIKKIINGLGSLGKAIGLLFKGEFSAAADAAKEGMVELGKGMMGANPIAIATKVVQDGDWTGAWEKRIQDSEKYNNKKNKGDKTPEIPEVPTAPFVPALPRILEDPPCGDDTTGSGKRKKTKETKETFRLNDLPENKLASSAYSSIVAKLNPVKLASLSAKAAASLAIPAMLATTTPVQAHAPVTEPDLTQTEYVNEQPDVLDVRIVSIADAGKLFGQVPELAVSPTPVRNNITVPELPRIQAPEVNNTVQVPEQTVQPLPEFPTIQAPVINIPEPTVIQTPELAVLPAPVTNNIAVPEIPNAQVPEVSNTVQIPEQTVQSIPELPTIQAPAITIPEPVVIQALELATLSAPVIKDVAAPLVNTTVQVPEPTAQQIPVKNYIATPELPVVQVPETVNTIQAPIINIPEPVIIQAPELAVLPTSITNNVAAPELPSLQVPEMAELPGVNGQDEDTANMRGYSRPSDHSRSVHIDQLTIHIAQADGKGYEQITEEIQDALIQALDYEA